MVHSFCAYPESSRPSHSITAATPTAVTKNEGVNHSLSDFPLYFWLMLRLDKSTAY